MRPIFLVLERDRLVAEDISELILGKAPTADIRISGEREEMGRIVDSLQAIEVAILHGNAETPDILELTGKIDARGGLVVILGEGELPDGFVTKQRVVFIRGPFSSEMIQSAIWDADTQDAVSDSI